MKVWHWITIIYGIFVLIIQGFLMAFVIFTDRSWWWFFTPFITFLVILLFFIVGVIVWHFARRPIKIIEITPETAEEQAIHFMKYDKHNPDNFVIEERENRKISGGGREPVSVLVLKGYGSELKQKRNAVINLSTKEMTLPLIDAEEPEIDLAVARIVHLDVDKIIEEETRKIDRFGEGTTTKKVIKPSFYEQKKKEEEIKTEEESSV